MKFHFYRWSKIPYAGQSKSPMNPIDPLARSWKTYYVRPIRKGIVIDGNGHKYRLKIRYPNTINWNQQLKKVQRTLKNIKKSQVTLAKYYGTGAPTKQWTPIIDRLIDTYQVSPTRAARILAAVQAGINDTMVIVWNLKYLWDVARPNQLNRKMETILCTPNFPAYPSGHATLSGCAAEILSYFFPAESKRLKQIAHQDALSRLYAGVHFPIDNTEGLRLGKQIGEIVINQLKRERTSTGKKIDTPFTVQRNAKLPPPPYKQVIPFTFNRRCHSKVKK